MSGVSRSFAQVLHVRVRVWVALIMASALVISTYVPSISQGAAVQPWLQIDGPQHVDVGQPIELTLTVKNATDIAGYETQVLFDTTAAHFTGLRQRKNDLKKLGRDVGPLTAVDLPNGIAIGLYSCPVVDCVAGKGPQQGKGGQGTIKLATLQIGRAHV